MEVREVNPDDLEIDPLNERTEDVGPDKDGESLEESVREQGVIEPPIVRKDENGQYLVIVGQRRTLAAQAVDLDRMPVIIMDLDKPDAIQASITENIDAFRKSVSRSDRATAVKQLMELKGWTISETAESLGVSRRIVASWLERTDDAWENTSIHVDNENDASAEDVKKTVDEIPDDDLATIRRATGSAEERERVVEKVQEAGLARNQIREARKRAANSDDSFEEVIDTISQEKEVQRDSGIKVEARITVAGHDAEALREAAKDLGTSEEGVVQRAIKDFLDAKGYR